jgi:hypothetical protein
MNCEIIEFSSFAAARTAEKATKAGRARSHRQARADKRAAKLLEVTTAPENFSETCRNHRMRQSRRDAWWAADRLTDYWRARFKWQYALEVAQQYGVADSASLPSAKDENRFGLVDRWRDAIVQQILTPAPDQGHVNWKRAQLRSGEHAYTKVKPERLQQAIDADVEWLAAHPSRKSIAATRQAKKGREIAVVATMPEADQEAISATFREILQEREQ